MGDPTIVTGGKGIRINDAEGRNYIDGFAGLYCVNIGYGRTEVAEAIARQAYQLAYYHTTSLSALAFAAARRLAWFAIPGRTILEDAGSQSCPVGERQWFRRSNGAGERIATARDVK